MLAVTIQIIVFGMAPTVGGIFLHNACYNFLTIGKWSPVVPSLPTSAIVVAAIGVFLSITLISLTVGQIRRQMAAWRQSRITRLSTLIHRGDFQRRMPHRLLEHHLSSGHEAIVQTVRRAILPQSGVVFLTPRGAPRPDVPPPLEYPFEPIDVARDRHVLRDILQLRGAEDRLGETRWKRAADDALKGERKRLLGNRREFVWMTLTFCALAAMLTQRLGFGYGLLKAMALLALYPLSMMMAVALLVGLRGRAVYLMPGTLVVGKPHSWQKSGRTIYRAGQSGLLINLTRANGATVQVRSGESNAAFRLPQDLILPFLACWLGDTHAPSESEIDSYLNFTKRTSAKTAETASAPRP